jgi:hypothetical protein
MPRENNAISYATVTPSWIYSYQCSSSLLINYVPVLVLSLVLSGLVVPLLKLIVIEVPYLWQRGYKTSRIIGGSCASSPFPAAGEVTGNHPDKDQITEEPRNDSFVSGGIRQLSKCVSTSSSKTSFRSPAQVISVFDGCNSVIRMYLNLGMLLTFGLASPLLTIGIAIDSWTNALLPKLLILKYVSGLPRHHNQPVDGHSFSPSTVSTEEYTGLLRSISDVRDLRPAFALNLVFAVMVCFWSIFVFDSVAGSVVGGTRTL